MRLRISSYLFEVCARGKKMDDVYEFRQAIHLLSLSSVWHMDAILTSHSGLAPTSDGSAERNYVC